MDEDINAVMDELRKVQVLLRTNNLLISRFILELSKTRKELGLPKRYFFFKFELLEDDYNQLVKEFGKDDTDKALYSLDRMLLTNKQECPNNIAKYIRRKIKKNRYQQEARSRYENNDSNN